MQKSLFFTAALLAVAACSVSAQAACVQADAAGRWSVHSMNSDDDVVRCTVSVNSYGTIAATTCTGYWGSQSGSVSLSGGKITLIDPTRCAYRGNLTFSGVANTVRDMALSSNKSVATGIGTYPGGSFFIGMTRF